MNEIEKLISGETLTHGEYVKLISRYEDENIREMLMAKARKLKGMYYGNKVYIRGLIEFTNYCRNGCLYCGINSSCKTVKRYRLSKTEILECCMRGYDLGFRTFVLQGGEDAYFTDDLLVDIISEVKEKYPDCAVTLSIGERSYESYKRLKEAGADRYLLRHETANVEHYKMLHPDNMSLENRKQCLFQLKELGFQVGAGFMVGTPGQTAEHLADDLEFLRELEPQMVGIGPFIPHHDTVFANESAGSVTLTLYLLAIIRILFPRALLPATTALGTMASDGSERGMLAGANVVMPNLSPINHRKDYDLYDNKKSTGGEAAEYVDVLRKSMKKIGYEVVVDRGDYIG